MCDQMWHKFWLICFLLWFYSGACQFWFSSLSVLEKNICDLCVNVAFVVFNKLNILALWYQLIGCAIMVTIKGMGQVNGQRHGVAIAAIHRMHIIQFNRSKWSDFNRADSSQRKRKKYLIDSSRVSTTDATYHAALTH